MTSKEFKRLCESSFDRLFRLAEDRNQTQFFTSFFAIFRKGKYKHLSYVLDEEFQEVLEFFNSFFPIQSSDQVDVKTRTRTRIMLYCHTIEVDLIYLVLYNMIMTIKDKEYSTIITFKDKRDEIREAVYAYKKIEIINKECEDTGIELKLIFDELFKVQIRNAFSHSQYCLSPNGGFAISKYNSPTTSKVLTKSPNQDFFTHGEIHELFKKVDAYLESFINIYKNYENKYADGKPYKTLFGEVYFDNKHGWCFYSNKLGQ